MGRAAERPAYMKVQGDKECAVKAVASVHIYICVFECVHMFLCTKIHSGSVALRFESVYHVCIALHMHSCVSMHTNVHGQLY